MGTSERIRRIESRNRPLSQNDKVFYRSLVIGGAIVLAVGTIVSGCIIVALGFFVASNYVPFSGVYWSLVFWVLSGPLVAAILGVWARSIGARGGGTPSGAIVLIVLSIVVLIPCLLSAVSAAVS